MFCYGAYKLLCWLYDLSGSEGIKLLFTVLSFIELVFVSVVVVANIDKWLSRFKWTKIN